MGRRLRHGIKTGGVRQPKSVNELGVCVRFVWIECDNLSVTDLNSAPFGLRFNSKDSCCLLEDREIRLSSLPSLEYSE